MVEVNSPDADQDWNFSDEGKPTNIYTYHILLNNSFDLFSNLSL